MRKIFLFSLTLIFCTAIFAFTPIEWNDKEFMALSEVKAGMTGYGLTVLEGQKIERFPIKIVDVFTKADFGMDMILIEVTGGTLKNRKMNGVAGMSGSPIYIKDRLIGAYAYGWSFQNEPVSGVTPIASMIGDTSSIEEKINGETNRSIQIGNHIYDGLIVTKDTNSTANDSKNIIKMTPLQTPVIAQEGIPQNFLSKISPLFDNAFIATLPLGTKIGGGVKLDNTLKPGSAVAVSYMYGDINLSAVGTVTYVKGDTVLAFGHPFNGIGNTDMPMSAAYVHTVISGANSSFKLASPTEVVGTMIGDRNFTIIGDTTRRAKTIPVDVQLNNVTKAYGDTCHVEIVNDPLFTADILYFYLFLTLANAVNPDPNAKGTFKLSIDFDTKEYGNINQHNYFSPKDMGMFGMPAEDFYDILYYIFSSNYGPLAVNKINMRLTYQKNKGKAVIQKIVPDRLKAKPGETVNIEVTVMPDGAAQRIFDIPVTIPLSTTAKNMNIVIGGSNNSTLYSLFNVQPMLEEGLAGFIRWYTQKISGYDLMAISITPDPAYPYMGQVIKNIPPKWQNILRYNFSSTGNGGTNGSGSIYDYYGRYDLTNMINLNQYTRTTAQVSKIDTEYLINGIEVLQIAIDATDKPGAGLLHDNGYYPQIPLSSSTIYSTLTQNNEPIEDEYLFYKQQRYPQSINSISHKKYQVKDDTIDLEEILDSNLDDDSHETEQEDDNISSISVYPTVLKSANDFIEGEFDGTVLSSLGRIIVAPAVNSYAFNENTLPSSICEYQGNIYISGFYSSDILIWDGKEIKSFISLPDSLAIIAIDIDKTNGVIAAATLNGSIYFISTDGKIINNFKTNSVLYDIKFCKNVLYAAALENDNMAVLYKVKDDNISPAYISMENKYFDNITIDNNKVYFVSQPKNRIYYYDCETGFVDIIFDSPEYITDIIVKNGIVYTGYARSGMINRIEHGVATNVAKVNGNNQKIINDMLFLDDVLYVLSGPGGGITKIINPESKSPETITIHPGSNGKSVRESILPTTMTTDGYYVYVMCNSPKQILTIGGGVNGTYTSPLLSTQNPATWHRIVLKSSGVDITNNIKTYFYPTPLSPTSYELPVGENGALYATKTKDLKFMVELIGTDNFDTAEIFFVPENRTPSVTFPKSLRGSLISGEYELLLQATDPDGDTLAYTIYISKDNNPWEIVEIIENDKAVYEATSGVITINTLQFENGTKYRFRTIVSDKYAKPASPLYTEMISDYFNIDNEKPVFASMTNADHTKVSFTMAIIKNNGISNIKGGKFRINNNRWIALVPVDGAFDSPYEIVRLIIPTGYPEFDAKNFTIEIIAEDMAGNTNSFKHTTIAEEK